MRKQKLVKTFLTAASLILSGCASTFPAVHPYGFNVKYQVCLPYVQTSKKPIRFEYKKDQNGKPAWQPIATCEGYYGFPPEDVAAVITWYNEKYLKSPKIQKTVQDNLVPMYLGPQR